VFTGIVEDIGQLLSRTSRGQGARIRVATRLSPLVLGESIAVMGVCVTVCRILDGAFEADASSETLLRSTLGRLSVGHRLHLERALAVGGRFGGHIVAGHVDGVGRLLARTNDAESAELTLTYDSPLAPFLAVKGSVAVDGVSLTVNMVDAHTLRVTVIPHTQDHTLFGCMSIGTEVNLEADVLARYVARWLDVHRLTEEPKEPSKSPEDALLSRLASSGFL